MFFWLIYLQIALERFSEMKNDYSKSDQDETKLKMINELFKLVDEIIFKNMFSSHNYHCKIEFANETDELDKVCKFLDQIFDHLGNEFVKILLPKNLNFDLLNNILIHEMIHAFLIHVRLNDQNEMHCQNFVKILNLISNKFSLNV